MLKAVVTISEYDFLSVWGWQCKCIRLRLGVVKFQFRDKYIVWISRNLFIFLKNSYSATTLGHWVILNFIKNGHFYLTKIYIKIPPIPLTVIQRNDIFLNLHILASISLFNGILLTFSYQQTWAKRDSIASSATTLLS